MWKYDSMDSSMAAETIHGGIAQNNKNIFADVSESRRGGPPRNLFTHGFCFGICPFILRDMPVIRERVEQSPGVGIDNQHIEMLLPDKFSRAICPRNDSSES